MPSRIGHPRRAAALLVFAALVLAPLPSHASWIYGGNQVSFGTDESRDPSVAPDGSGGVYVAWVQQTQGVLFQGDIVLQRYSALGEPMWPVGGIAVCSAPGDQLAPVAVQDDSGNVYVAWEDRRDPGAGIYAQRIQADGTALWAANGVQVAPPQALDYPSRLAAVTDRNHGLYLAWCDVRSRTDATLALWTQRVNWQGIPQWPWPGIVSGLMFGYSPPPALSSNQSTGLFAAWNESSGSTSNDIRAQRVTPLGAPQWGADGVLACDAVGDQTDAAIAAWNGGALVAWYDGVFGNVAAQRLDGTGTAHWAAGGKVMPLTGASGYPAVLAEGSDAYVSSSTSPIQLARIDGTGATMWTTEVVYGVNGVAPRLVSDGSGGAHVIWHYTASGNSNIYDRRMLAGGTAAWDHYLKMTSGTVDHEFPAVTYDGTGGIYVSWHDLRTGINQVYVTRVASYGVVPSLGVAVVPPRIALGLPRPQPACGNVTLSLTLPDAQPVGASVLDAAGRLVRELLDGGALGPGEHTLRWNARAANGAPVPAGLYFVRVTTREGSWARRVVILN